MMLRFVPSERKEKIIAQHLNISGKLRLLYGK